MSPLARLTPSGILNGDTSQFCETVCKRGFTELHSKKGCAYCFVHFIFYGQGEPGDGAEMRREYVSNSKETSSIM